MGVNYTWPCLNQLEVGRQAVPTVHSRPSFRPSDKAEDPSPVREYPSEERPDMTVVTIWDADYIYSADTILLLKPYSGEHFAPTQGRASCHLAEDSTLDAQFIVQKHAHHPISHTQTSHSHHKSIPVRELHSKYHICFVVSIHQLKSHLWQMSESKSQEMCW